MNIVNFKPLFYDIYTAETYLERRFIIGAETEDIYLGL